MKSAVKIIFICPYPIGQSPSQRFRFEQYLENLRASGFQLTIAPFLSMAGWQVLYQPGNYFKKFMALGRGFCMRWLQLIMLPAYHYIFIHREAAPVGPPVFEWLFAILFRKKIIYDFDDAIWIPNTSAVNRAAAFFKNHEKVKHICRWSYKISAGNEYLCKYAATWNPRVVYNPTTIDTETLHNPVLYPINKKGGLCIGWTGSHSTLRYLDQLKPVFTRLQEEFPELRLRIIADKTPNLDLRFVEFVAWNKDTEIADLLEIDIGIMPLTDDAWAKGKCGFKALQYLALGIPAVVSPVGVNPVIVSHGSNGFLAVTEDDWMAALRTLLCDPALRKAVGAKGRLTVEQHYSVRSNAANFVGLFR